MKLYSLFGVAFSFDPFCKHVSSPILPTRALAAVRLLFAFYTLVTLIISLAWTSVRDHAADGYFSYFTHLSYIGICAYFFTSGIHTARVVRAVPGSPATYPLQKWPQSLQLLYILLQSTITTYSILVTIVFWALLADPSVFSTMESAWENISVHIMNTVFVLAELLFTNIPPAPWLTLPCSIFFLACYLAVAYITHVSQGFYPYAFLDPKKQGPLLAAYIIGILVGYSIIFILVRGLVILRIRIITICFTRHDGDSSLRSEPIDEWERVERPSKEIGTAV